MSWALFDKEADRTPMRRKKVSRRRRLRRRRPKRPRVVGAPVRFGAKRRRRGRRMRRIIVQRATALSCRLRSRQTPSRAMDAALPTLGGWQQPCSADGRSVPSASSKSCGRCAGSVTTARYRPGQRYQLADRAAAGGDSAPPDSRQSGVSIRTCTVQRSTHECLTGSLGGGVQYVFQPAHTVAEP